MPHVVAGRVNNVLATLIGVLALSSILLNWEYGGLLMGLLFWLSLPIAFGSRVSFEDGRLVVQWGWPLRFLKMELKPEEVVEIVYMDRAEGVSLLKYWKASTFLSLLWVAVGLAGLMKRPSESFIWLNWVYWGILPMAQVVFPSGRRLEASAFVILLSAALALWAEALGLQSYPAFIFFGLMFVLSFYVEPFKESRLAIVTERGTYLVSSPFERDVEELVKRLGTVYAGGGNGS